MINETTKMRDARHQLQLLSASDPHAQVNILRHVATYTQLLTGRTSDKALPREPLVGAGFPFVEGEERLFGALTRRDGLDRIYIAFDIDDAQASPIGISLFRKDGDHVVCYGLCKLWSPVNGGRALLVPTGEGGAVGYFAFRPGQPFRWVAGPVPGDFNAGMRRAQSRLACLLKVAESNGAPCRGFATVISNVKHAIITRSLPMAA